MDADNFGAAPDEHSPLLKRSYSAPHSKRKQPRLGTLKEDLVEENFREDEIDLEEDDLRRRDYHRYSRRRLQRRTSVVNFANMLLNQLDGPYTPASSPLLSSHASPTHKPDTPTSASEHDLDRPPHTPHISAYDVCRLFIVALLYLLLAGVAVVAVVYSVQSILKTLQTPVRSVIYQKNSRYPPISIAIAPDFSTYLGCYVRYFDDISPDPAYNSSVGPEKCVYSNVTFSSLKLNMSRFAMVFQSPIDAANKQLLCINYTINTTARDYSAIEYWMMDDWDHFNASNETDRETLLAHSEFANPLHTFPAGMRTLAKLSKIIEEDLGGGRSVRFEVEPNFARYNRDTVDSGVSHLQIMFEWRSPVYELYREVPPIAFWSAAGSICGVLITIWKLAEIGTALVKKLRRERKKMKRKRKRMESKSEQDPALVSDPYNENECLKFNFDSPTGSVDKSPYVIN